MTEPRPLGEFELIDWFRARAQQARGRTVLGIGDDCALLRFAAEAETLKLKTQK